MRDLMHLPRGAQRAAMVQLAELFGGGVVLPSGREPGLAELTAEPPVLDTGRSVQLVHGDLHFENVLWDNGHISAVLDLEWARPEAPVPQLCPRR